MSNIGSYTSRSFSESQKFLVLDPSTGTTSLVLGSDLVSYITPQLNAVNAESTRLAAENTDYDVGEVIQTTGATSPGDNFAATYLVVEGGTGDFPMLNGNDLLVIKGDELLREQLISNDSGEGSDLVTYTGNSKTVTEALDERVIRKETIAQIEALTPTSDFQVSLSGLREGIFKFDGSDLSSEVALDTQQGIYIAPSSDPTGASGAWVRQYSGIANIEWFGAVGDDSTDNWAAIQGAVDSGIKAIFIPEGKFIVSDTIRESTNGYGFSIYGETTVHSRLKADPSMTVPIVWVGNSNGNGNYRQTFENFYVEGNGNTGCHGLVLHEAGTSFTSNLRVTDCDIGIFAPGMIGSAIKDCEMNGNNRHIVLSKVVAGTPSSIDDTTTTAGPIPLKNNVNHIRDCWMAGGTQGVSVEGGLTIISNCTFQSVGDSTTSNIINLEDANEFFDYGGGPIVEYCWFEGGQYRSMVNVKNTRRAVVRGCFMSGNSTNSETAIIAENADQVIIEQNSIRDTFDATPTDGRSVNAPIYVYTGNSLHYRVRDNYITNVTGKPYFDGESLPEQEKEFWPVAAGRFIGTASPSIVNGYQFTGIVRSAIGEYRCQTSGKFNIESPTTVFYSITTIGSVSAKPVVSAEAGGFVEVQFYDDTGASVDVDEFSVIVYGQAVGQGS